MARTAVQALTRKKDEIKRVIKNGAFNTKRSKATVADLVIIAIPKITGNIHQP